MSWIGRKKLALVPVYRPNAHPPDDIPADWPDQILQRVLFDPDPQTAADRSLRAYIHTASSGLADLDAVVQPMQTIDEQDVPVDALEGTLGSQLRGQGFDAAAIVMLGGVGAGTAQRGGFWARFVMLEKVGVWAMEFMHCLTGFHDLYPFFGNMGGFDEMDCSCGTHPSAYTKAAISWLDPSAIARHTTRTAAYDLYSVGLVQPPPSGRWAAVQIGSEVPYLMVEARQKVDQFDGGIPSEGVIVYEIQTSDPLGGAQNNTAPINLLTTTALSPGMTFTSAAGISVQVSAALPAGFSVAISDPLIESAWNLDDLTSATGAPSAAGNPFGYTWDVDDTEHVVYRGGDGHIHELWFHSTAWNHNDLTSATGAPSAAGDPAGYTWSVDSTEHVVYRGNDGHIHELWYNSAWGHNDLTAATGAPSAAGDPVGYTWTVDSTQHVVYRGDDGHIHELWYNSAWGHNDLTAATGAPSAAGDPSGYTWDIDSTQHVVYRGTDGHIHELWYNSAWGHNDLTSATGAPSAAGDPAGYTWSVDSTQHVVYRGNDGHIHELWYNSAWGHNDLTSATGAPSAIGDPMGYTWNVDSTEHVVYRGSDGHIHELWFNGNWNHNDLTIAAAGPSAAGDPAGYTWADDSTQHVVYRADNGHIFELWFTLS